MTLTDRRVLPFTGERFTPECEGEIWHEHWHRYLFVAPLVQGLRVLDAACGEGYGSAFLSRHAAQVTGVDIDGDAIEHARARYAQHKNLTFESGSVTALSLAAASVDVVVSFETIEHLAGQREMLAEFRRVLTPGGLLVLSSPNRPVYSDEQNYRNEFHVKELDRVELDELLGKSFAQRNWFGQRLVFQSMLWALGENDPQAQAQLNVVTGQADAPADATLQEMYFVVVCGGTEASLPELPSLSALVAADQKIYQQYRESYVMAMEQRAQLAKLEARCAEQAITLAAAVNTPNPAAAAANEASGLSVRVVALEQRLRYRESVVGWLRWPFSLVKQRLFSQRDRNA